MPTGLAVHLRRCFYGDHGTLQIASGADYLYAWDPAERHPDLAVSAKGPQGRAVDEFTDFAG